MIKNKGFIIAATIWLVIGFGIFAKVYGSEIKDQYSIPIKVSEYVYDCDKVDRGVFVACWNYDLDAPLSGWSIVDGELIKSGNIVKKPNFYKDKEVASLKPTDYALPFHRGHTFANDEDNDYSVDSIKQTYNMLNITPMYGQINIGIWRKVENFGDTLATEMGSTKVLAITLIEYKENQVGKYHGTKIDYARIPSSYTRIYVSDLTGEEFCFKVDNIAEKVPNDSLEAHRIDCNSIKIRNIGNSVK